MKMGMGSMFLALGMTAASAFATPTCQINFSGCNTGAGWVSADGRALTQCQWFKELAQSVSDLQTVNSCTASGKTCAIQTSGCNEGAAWISYDGKQLTACEWMADFSQSYLAAGTAGLCAPTSATCEYRTSSSCNQGAGIVFVNGKAISGCQWLSDASTVIRNLRGGGACK